MALLITDQCINCDMCVAECPNQAIFEGEKVYEIDAERCTECVGFYERQTCVDVCPIECILPDPAHKETREELLNRFYYLNLFG
ncbi:YfhL family 4Fe-4S dicluster ferredoxin [Acinetobacter chinensis]|jgi:ferredoxin|uniref:YfhL family 4Fe-4S dicluster ferredoxin n=1 Tax=Acinetobacter chinensis TaxID=2004650 RepID=A0A3B7LXW7_9GAMM|nr:MULTISPECIES: YfhL family 4Fe-4S dicluster ferredoxin [Acinetobacter]AXY57231.1 YfhL family 4Fe-4S dicluster ferredoxin [Acinetobacter chinensis]AXY60611.1 YfhL family 4Fe-4S dicluster ferredoxin [Acinetobacter sp. WCHAc010052]MDV2468600.1 YfhL family 4Fe-4S dicluster ferredoxin [Acinetobacter chinensis]WOE40531.1 YfhL family 4Fe-4S dicluster ferredoxin [Acinetobacter chinensis]